MSSRDEFIRAFQMALSGRVSQGVVDDQVRYYSDYILMEIRSGKKESEVLERLGDPRLLAKTVIASREVGASSDRQEYSGEEYYQRTYQQGERTIDLEEEAEYNQRKQRKKFRIPLWVWVGAVLLVVLLIFALVFSVLWALLPIILPVILVIFIFRLLYKDR